MKLILILINLLLNFFVTVGDFFIFYIQLILTIIKKIVEFLEKFYTNTYKKFRRYKNTKIKSLKNYIELIRFKETLFLKKIKRRRALVLKKEKREKAITIYPIPKNILLKTKYFLLGFLVCIIFLFIPFTFYVFLNSLPNPKQLSGREIPQTSKIYDRNGILLYQIYANENRTLVNLNSIPANLKNATIAIEDKDFYKNPGIDINAIIRASIANLSGRPIQGGSTITQQLIKSTLLTPEKTIKRKIKEIILAFWAEKIYSKNEILEMYFNQVPYGGTAWGIEAASETYFGKNVKDLSLAQSAFLAGLPQSPTIYSPYEGSNFWQKRQKEVLNKMQELKYITKKQELEALSENLVFQTPQIPIYAPHFVMYVKNLLIQKYGLALVEKGGLNVITTLDLMLNEKVADIVREEVDNNNYLNLTNGAALVTNPATGEVLAMVGSRDYNDPNDGNVNLTTALRQPGSSIKVVTYAAALSNGFTAATILDDSPVTYNSPGAPPYSPVNYDGAFHGKIPLRIAFANSFNVPAVKTLQKIGIPEMVATAKNMGITTWGDPSQYGLSLTLGAAEVKMTELATVYGTISNLGKRVNLNPIIRVTNYKGDMFDNNNKVLAKQVLDPGVAYIIANILADNRARSFEFGTNSPLNIPNRTVSVKTGTSDNKRDNWTIGFTKSFLVAAWVGNNDNSPMSQSLASGITGAAPIWNRVMTAILPNVSDALQKMPDNIVVKTCYGVPEYFIKGTEQCTLVATPSAVIIRN
ncbi:MAG: transglycosylase domain-containing protein [Patescibacteria group bacterium]